MGLSTRSTYVADQLCSSGSNVLTVLLMSHVLTVEGFGRFSAAYVALLAAVEMLRALFFEGWVVDGGPDHPALRPAWTFTLMIVPVGAGIFALLALAHLVRFSLVGMLAYGIAVAGYGLQDAVRYRAFARNEPEKALSSDLGWLVSVAGIFGAVMVVGPPPVDEDWIAWLWLGLLPAVWAFAPRGLGAQLTVIPNAADVRRTLEAFLDAVPFTAALLLPGAVYGAAVTGAVNAVRTVFGVVVVVGLGLYTSKLGRRVRGREVAMLASYLTVVAAGVGVVARTTEVPLLLFDDRVWNGARVMVWPVGALVVAKCLHGYKRASLKGARSIGGLLRLQGLHAAAFLCCAAILYASAAEPFAYPLAAAATTGLACAYLTITSDRAAQDADPSASPRAAATARAR